MTTDRTVAKASLTAWLIPCRGVDLTAGLVADGGRPGFVGRPPDAGDVAADVGGALATGAVAAAAGDVVTVVVGREDTVVGQGTKW
jgi:hypothetical protein